jgi:hypothetical protein
VEESLTDDTRVALVFSSQGLPLSIGRAALDAMETTYDLMMATAEEKASLVEEVCVSVCVCQCVNVRVRARVVL